MFDNRLHVTSKALGINGQVPRVQGNRITSKREIRVASLFRDVPPEFLRMIVAHELAHLKEREHDRAFYQLCRHIEPAYHELEFDLRLYLTQRELLGKPPA
jgi:predicted metal-dependent hydrolase